MTKGKGGLLPHLIIAALVLYLTSLILGDAWFSPVSGG